VAARLDVPVEQVIEAIDVASARTSLSTDSTANASDDGPEPILIPALDEGFDRAEARAVLRPALAKLAPREQEILMLRYFGEHTQAEIGRMVGISQMQVSRLLSRALTRLKENLATPPRTATSSRTRPVPARPVSSRPRIAAQAPLARAS
jgi:RNA polymerase sigma-B factor